MINTRNGSARIGRLALAATLCASAVDLARPAFAAEPRSGATLVGDAGPEGASAALGRRLDLSIGRSLIIDLPRDAKEVFVANPAVANAVVRSVRKIFLIGVANGATSIFVMDAEGRQITSFEVNVGRDLSVLRQTLRQTIPTGRIDVRPAGDSILLTGTVSSAGDAQQALDIAKAFVGQAASSGNSGGAPGFSGSVINSLTVVGRDQVMIKVSIVEMARSAVKQLGINFGGNWNVLDAANAFTNPASTLIGLGTGAKGSLSGSGASINGQYRIPGENATVGGTLTALEQAGLSRVLAEPTLVAISGESANFQAGGEIPIAITTCAGGSCTPSVLFKPYGISLAFTPVVLSENRISLHVSTEVSEIDRSTADSTTGTPGFKTRRTSTSIEVPSGGTVVTAGLISSQSGQTISGVPGLINLPIIGALFRSRDFQRRDTELMIAVTPYVAKPMEARQVARPDDGFVDATDPQTVLFGRLNKIYGGAGPAPKSGYGGRVGFITD
jgi:pilus assembly protein CpaC